jgi:hypothetical protein
MNDDELDNWVADQREKVTLYLESQGIANPNVGDWPAFEMAPYFGIWAIESQKVEGKIGWWAFSGDCPTDYVSENGKCHPREALKDLIQNWKTYVPYMKEGEQPPNTKLGDSSNLKELGEMLEKRVTVLSDWCKDDSLWEER